MVAHTFNTSMQEAGGRGGGGGGGRQIICEFEASLV